MACISHHVGYFGNFVNIHNEMKRIIRIIICIGTNIKNKLEKMGGSMDDIFKCTCMLSDIKDWPLMSQEYKKFFNPQKLPARSAFAGSGLALGAKLEIECMAIKKN